MRSENHIDGGVRSMTAWRWTKPRLAPAVLIALGVLLLAWVAARASTESPPSATEYGLVVLFSSALNITGGALLARIGRVQPTHARSAVRRLIRIGNDMAISQRLLRVGESDRSELPASINDRSADALLGSMSGHLLDAIQDWVDVHGDALQEVLELEAAINRSEEY